MSTHIAYLDGPRLRRSLVAACEYTRQQRQELNRINVFPVPDGDTGTNLALTVEAIADRLRRNRDRDVSTVADQAAEAALLGARGNSGMMLSHFLLGFAAQLKGRRRVGPRGFASALAGGIDNLYDALDDPVEGTILTVIRDTANAAREAVATDFVPYVEGLVDAARKSLERTPSLLPVLKEAGVVDAGGRGFVHMLEGVLLLINGDPIVAGDDTDYSDVPSAVAEMEYPADEEQYRYCTEALVRTRSSWSARTPCSRCTSIQTAPKASFRISAPWGGWPRRRPKTCARSTRRRVTAAEATGAWCGGRSRS